MLRKPGSSKSRTTKWDYIILFFYDPLSWLSRKKRSHLEILLYYYITALPAIQKESTPEINTFFFFPAHFFISFSILDAMSMSSNQMKLAMDESYQVFKQVCKQKTGNLYFIETYMAEPVGGAEVRTDENFALNNCLTLGDWYSMPKRYFMCNK